ncbi:COMM domain-containing protein 4 [Culicoides brevitarsis]|uniref:COMM domain-containing protein 4 n=1 Tax=Culicoides brevitarsis TaxID=469753 RepID=UPI00307BECA8
MKFRFCGDGDCPDWVLTGIHSQLVTLSSIKLRLFAQHVARSILGEDLPEDKVRDAFGVDAKGSNLDVVKAAISCLRYLMVNAVKFDTETMTFNEELQQLGFPKEHAAAICKVVEDFSERIRRDLAGKVLKVDAVEDVEATRKGDFVQLQFKVTGKLVEGVPQKNFTEILNVHKNDVPLLLKELKTAHEIMKQYDEGTNKMDEN